MLTGHLSVGQLGRTSAVLRRYQRLSKCLGGCEDLRRGAAALQDGRDRASGSATGFPMGVPLKGPRSEHGENCCFTAGWGPAAPKIAFRCLKKVAEFHGLW